MYIKTVLSAVTIALILINTAYFISLKIELLDDLYNYFASLILHNIEKI